MSEAGENSHVAVHQPDTRVISLESDNECAAGTESAGEQRDVAADGVVEDEVGWVGGLGLGQDGEVVAVEMDWVGELLVIYC